MGGCESCLKHVILTLTRFSCVFCSLKEILEAMEAHIILEPDLYSIKNMLDVKNGELCKKLRNTIVLCDKHITNCQVYFKYILRVNVKMGI